MNIFVVGSGAPTFSLTFSKGLEKVFGNSREQAQWKKALAIFLFFEKKETFCDHYISEFENYKFK